MSSAIMSSSHGGGNPGGKRYFRSLSQTTTTPTSLSHLGPNPLTGSRGNSHRKTSTVHKERIQKRDLKRCPSIDVTDSLDEAATERPVRSWKERLVKLWFFFVKYTFVGINVLTIASSVFQLFISNAHNDLWTPDNSLLILGLIFGGIILSSIGISGGIKQEFYLVLTYSAFMTILIVMAIVNDILESTAYLIVVTITHALIPYYYTFILYNRPSQVIILAADLSPATFYSLARGNSTVKLRSKSVILRDSRSGSKRQSRNLEASTNSDSNKTLDATGTSKEQVKMQETIGGNQSHLQACQMVPLTSSHASSKA